MLKKSRKKLLPILERFEIFFLDLNYAIHEVFNFFLLFMNQLITSSIRNVRETSYI